MSRIIVQKVLAAAFLLLSLGSHAQTSSINVVTSAVPFLRITPDARAGGMGDLGVATSPDANAQYYNLAKYPFATGKSSLAVNFTPWLKDLGLNDVYLGGLSGYYKLDEEQALSGSLRYFSLGDVHFTDHLGNDLRTFRPSEFSVDAGYSRKLSQKLSLGVAMRYINSNLAGGQAINGVSYKAGNAVAGDLGLFYTSNPAQVSGWNIGMALTNLGSKIGYTSDLNRRSFIPANFALGVNYARTFQEVHKVSFGMDTRKLLVPTPPAMGDSLGLANYQRAGIVSSWLTSWSDAPGGFSEELQEFNFSVGAEYTYNHLLSVRGGYFYESPSKGNRQYFSLGTGITYNAFNLNFSYLIPSGTGVNRNPLSNTLRFSLVFDMGGNKSAKTKK
jgi:hypothetical protein